MSGVSAEQSYYDDPALWRKERYLGNERELRRFATCADLLPPGLGSLLDVGAGNGAFLAFLEQRGTSTRLLGLERSPVAIEAALCRTRIEQGSVDRLPFDDGAFDCVSAMEVLEHLPHGVFERALREIARVSRDSILLSVPYRERRRNVTCPYCGCDFNPNYHMRSFDEETLARLFPGYRMTRTGFVTVPEHVLMPAVLRVRSWLGLRRQKPTALCPQS